MPDPEQMHPTGLPSVSPDEMEQVLQLDDAVPSAGYHSLPMIGLGGSAGSIPALQAFFKAVPKDTGMVFVVILHLAPEHESTLAEILGRSTFMPVKQAEGAEIVEPNHVYVIPPGKHLLVTDGRLKLVDLQPKRGKRVAVDLFFRTLADTHGPHASAIVLSGGDGDGAIGIKRIKERGGLTIAQDPDEAEHPSMPRTAIATGMVDWVLRVAEMPQRLLEYRDRERRLRLPPEEGPQPAGAAVPPSDVNEAALRDVLSYLRMRTGRDFSCYKRATIVRRISRRLQVNGMDDLQAYLDFMRTHPGEAGALLQDLLISVTNFFRDRQAFNALEAEIPSLFKGKAEGDSVRVWVPACATGEEAYSIAMLLIEHARKMDSAATIQVFASDLDENAIQVARAGFYPETITADVSEERLRSFFVKEAKGYRIRREVRETVLFAAHDMLKDVPFSRLDLISCRNLLIYLSHDAKLRAFDIFHFALRTGGRLFLGTSETVEDGSALFSPLDKKARLYAHRANPRVGLPVPEAPSVLARIIEASQRARNGPIVPDPGGQSDSFALKLNQHDEEGKDARLPWSSLHFRLLGRFGPTSVVINREHEIVHLSENAGRFLQFAGGTPSTNIFRAVHPELRVDLRTALFEASDKGSPVDVFDVPAEIDGRRMAVHIRVAPGGEIAPEFCLITFDSFEAGSRAVSAQLSPSQDLIVQKLERELDQRRDQLHDTVEQYEAANEELKASNEELQAMNEELRSATEELETSREELQSVNEELITVNDELKKTVDEVSRANSDLNNLVASTAIPTVFLDRELRIMRFTPPASTLFNVIPGDVGRPLGDLRHRLNYPEMLADAARVLEHLTPVEREVSSEDDRWYLARLVAYRANDDRIGGVVLNFIEITEQTRAAEILRANQERYQQLFDAISEGFCAVEILDDAEGRPADYRFLEANPAFARQMGLLPPIGRTAREVFGSVDPELFQPCIRTATTGTPERFGLRAGAAGRWFDVSASRIGGPGSRRVALLFNDTTERRLTEAHLKEHQQRLEQALESASAADAAKNQFLATLSHELRTPLNPVLMLASEALGDPAMPDSMRQTFEVVRKNVELEARLIDDLLDLTRITRGALILRMQLVDVRPILEDAIENVRAELTAKQLHLTRASRAAHTCVTGDPVRLQQVFWNVLSNAAKFTPAGGNIRIEVDEQADSQAILITIADTGMGMTADEIARVFTPFAQGDHVQQQDAKPFGGLGLGLSIASKLVELHGGQITVLSPGKGQGCVFTIRLPLACEDLDAPDHSTPRPSDAKSNGALGQLRILAVEDHASTLVALTTLLRRRGHVVVTATTVAEASARAKEGYDLLMSDLGLPDGTGYDVLNRLRQVQPDIVAVALSGYGMEKDLQRSTTEGFEHHVVKPISVEQLDAIIQRVQEARGKRGE